MTSAAFSFHPVTVAAVQTAPAFLDRSATIGIIAERTAAAAARGAGIVAFSEAFLPGFPTWSLVLAPTLQHDLTTQLYEQAVDVPGPTVDALGEIAAENEVVLSVGITERSTRSVGTMWNANLVFGADGSLLNHRRKLVPTWAEKLVWSNGDGRDLGAFPTPLGRVGALICGENTNPLARFAMIDTGEQIHIAPYPPVWPTRKAGEERNYDLTYAITLRSAAHSFEGKLTTIAVSGLVGEEELTAIASFDPSASKDVEAAPLPVSAIIGPDGRPIGEPLVGEDGIIVETVRPSDSIHLKQIHDVSGGYQRFDIFNFSVSRERRDQGMD